MQAIAGADVHALCASKVTPDLIRKWHALGAAHSGSRGSSAVLIIPYPQLQTLFKVRNNASVTDIDWRAHAATLMRQGAGLVIADEAHTIKNPKAQVRPC